MFRQDRDVGRAPVSVRTPGGGLTNFYGRLLAIGGDMLRASAVLAALLVSAPASFGQAAGAPNHSNGSTTRTQTIQPGEPYTNAPGGNPGRTTGRTGNQSPFGNQPPAPPAPANPAT